MMLSQGDVVEIPLPDGRVAIGWILYVSKYFKNCVGFVIFGIKGQVREDVVYQSGTDVPESMMVLGPLYTNIEAAIHYGWKPFAHQPVSENKLGLTRRDVGGDVYVGDENLGPMQPSDNLPAMIARGMLSVYREIENAFPGSA